MKDKALLNTLVLGGSVIIASFGLFFFGKTIMNQIKRRRDERDEDKIEGDEAFEFLGESDAFGETEDR
jgi:hypothetical protein